jgi:hypothetical protein
MPIIFTIFANPKGDLTNLSLEQNGIQDALDPLVSSKKIEHLIRTDTDRAAFFNMVRTMNSPSCTMGAMPTSM